MLTSSFAAVVPIVCVTLAGLAAMVAEAFRKDDERMPIGILGVIGLAFSMAACLVLWNRNASAFNGTIQADNFGLFVCVTIVVVGLLTMALSGPAIETRAIARGRVLHADAFRDRRHDDDGACDGSAHHLRGPRDPVALGVRADRSAARRCGEHGRRVQVLPARCLLERVLPLRHRARVRADGQHSARPHRRVRGLRRAAHEPDAAVRARPAARRFCVQDLGGSVPHVDAGRLRRRSDDRDRIHVHRREGCRVCRVRARLPHRAWTCRWRLGSRTPRRRHRDDGGRHRRRRRAGQPEADARVFEHRARRIPPGRPRRRAVRRTPAGSARHRSCSICWSTR